MPLHCSHCARVLPELADVCGQCRREVDARCWTLPTAESDWLRWARDCVVSPAGRAVALRALAAGLMAGDGVVGAYLGDHIRGDAFVDIVLSDTSVDWDLLRIEAIDRSPRLVTVWIEDELAVGRDDRQDAPQLLVRSPTVSRRHCTLLNRNGHLLCRDDESSGGVRLHDHIVPSITELKKGDIVWIGQLRLEPLVL